MSDKDILLTLLCRESIENLGVSFECNDDKNQFIDMMLDEKSKNDMYEAILDILDKRYKELTVEVK